MKIGFLVNPIAGMGGRVGLKGTNHVLAKAKALGAEPVSPARAVEFLRKLKADGLDEKIDVITCPGIMGNDEVGSAGLRAQVLPMSIGAETSSGDTKSAIALMVKNSVDLIVFVGGDGTAKDIFDALEDKSTISVLGVPSGVKMYSAVFAASVLDAVEVLSAFVNNEAQVADLEIVDTDEEAIREDRFSTRLYGFLKGPFVPLRLVGSKQVTSETLGEHENQMAVARFVVEEMKPAATYILGPGTTVKCIADLLAIQKTLLGVDIYQDKRVVKDVNEEQILREIKNWSNTWLVVSPIGRQGMLLGRGNQQISPRVLERIGKERLVVTATRNKIQGIDGCVLRVDTGDAAVDEMFKGYVKVAIDYREWRLMQVV